MPGTAGPTLLRPLAFLLVVGCAVATALGTAPARAEVGPSSTPASVRLAAEQGQIVGRAVGPDGSPAPRAKVVLFDERWNYLTQTKARRTGRFAFASLAPGTYRVQVSDARPRWDTSSYATTDGTVTVHHDRTSVLTVRMQRGAFITGRVSAGPRRTAARHAWVRASDAYGRSYEVRADAKGRFALGGLPAGTFMLWGYDSAHQWVGSGTSVKGLATGGTTDIRIGMPTRAGGLSGFLFEGPDIARHRVWVTAVSKRTGQWWVVPVRTGDLSLRGLAPGRYTFSMTSTRTYVGRTVSPGVSVKSGVTRTLNLRLTQPQG